MTDIGPTLWWILEQAIGTTRAEQLFHVLYIHPALRGQTGNRASRALIAQALNMLLFENLIDSVPVAKQYMQDCLRSGQVIVHDHGAVRTVALSNMADLPAGEEAFLRILRPLGYVLNGTFPLDRIKMTGRSYAQQDYPEDIGQFFISELHPERFSVEFQAAVERVTSTSKDILSPDAERLLAHLESEGGLDAEVATRLLPVLVACFDRHHTIPFLSDYDLLLQESAEMAWISTEGNMFNHATSRVPDVELLNAQQKALGRPIKDTVETSQSGRIRQTAFRAPQVNRTFRTADGSTVQKEVPGSFYEFITRLPFEEDASHPRLDLGFDSSNAQAIFKMTAKID